MNDPFDLHEYAKQHRLRTRNLHDGGRCPPARTPPRAKPRHPAYVGEDDRLDAVVGYDGYVFAQDGRLYVYLCFKTARGVNRAIRRIEQLGGAVDQVGDFEVGGTLPVREIKAGLALIRVSRLSPGNPEAIQRRKRPQPLRQREPELTEVVVA